MKLECIYSFVLRAKERPTAVIEGQFGYIFGTRNSSIFLFDGEKVCYDIVQLFFSVTSTQVKGLSSAPMSEDVAEVRNFTHRMLNLQN